ncbi:LytR family transcriptional regulator [Candidatus Saccharibacteria bacterium CPR2]|nr:LytR family transcriptional regulator [Candidatus Saccharibacteria bacterium CPR2]
MKKRSKPLQIDGIVYRQRRKNIGTFVDSESKRHEIKDFDSQTSPQLEENSQTNMPKNDQESIRFDFSLDEAPKTKKRFGSKIFRWRKNGESDKKDRPRWFRFGKKTTIIGGAILAIIIVFLGVKLFFAIRNIVDRAGDGALALQDNVDPSMLNGEGDGRVNILLMGIGGEGHEAPNLADTIIVASIDPFAHEVALLSIPRDFYVEIDGYGSSRINAAHAYGEDYGYEGGGVALMEKTVEEVLDIPIHYYVRADFAGFVQAVNAVGGVDVNVTNPVYDDYNIAWQNGGVPYTVEEGWHHFDGQEALLFVRSRYTSARGDFDRGERQRQLLTALKDRVLSLGTFSNPAKLYSLIDSAGNHVRTNLQISEMLRLYEIGKEVQNDKIISVGLDNGEDNYLKSANIGGASVLIPKLGEGNYEDIQKYVRSIFVDGFLRKEGATVDVLNGSGIEGLATEKADELKSYSYNVINVDNAPIDNLTTTSIYDLSNNSKPYTKRYLEQRFKTTMKSRNELPQNITTQADFLIIIGSDAAN